MAVASLWRNVLRRAMGKWRSKSYSRAPDDGACSPEEAVAAAGCATSSPAGPKGSISAAVSAPAPPSASAGGADERSLATNGASGWDADADADADGDAATAASGERRGGAGGGGDGAGGGSNGSGAGAGTGPRSDNGNGPMHNGSAKANGHPPPGAGPAPSASARAPPGPGGGGGGGDDSPGVASTSDGFDVDDEAVKCGSGPCVPRWLQVFASKQAFLVTFCIAWVLQGMYYTYFVSVITTIEKLFQIQSKTTGIIMSATEIGQIGSSLSLTYYGGQGHRPKWIAWGMVSFSVSSFTCAVPHFIFGRQFIEANDLSYRGNASELMDLVCRSDDSPFTNATCEAYSDDRRSHSKHTTIVLAIFFISSSGVGMGQTAVYTLGIPYIDDNVASRESPLYFAITIGVRILGPASGFSLGSMCTRIYADPYTDPQIEPTDPRWVGAWWSGSVSVSSSLMSASFAMFAFPKRSRTSRNPPRPSRCGKKNSSLRDFPKAVKRLLKNDILMFRTASSVLHISPIAGLYTFLPKYSETQFRLPAHKANMISGIGGILVMGLGIIISGVFILRVKPNARFVAAWIAFTAVVYAIGMGILMFIGCPMDDFAGLVPGRTPSFMPECANVTNCQCDVKKFSPVCGSDNRTYYSACHAGCRNVTEVKNEKGKYEFLDCECISNSSNAHSKVLGKAEQRFCESKCTNYVWYILLFSVFVFIHSTSEVGSMLLISRCVDPRDKAMASGLIQFAIGLFGNVPCPIVYGAVVDYACMVWEETVCGEQGACWSYDSNIFRMFYHGTTGAILLCAFFVDIIVWYKAGSINFVDEPGPNPQEEESNPIAGRARSETSV